MENPSGEAAEVSLPPYFAVSLLKFSVMCIFTFGIYIVWWHYINWCRIKERERTDIMPAWRALFYVLWCYPCQSRIRATTNSLNLQTWLPAGPLCVGLVVTGVLSRLPDPYWLLSVLSFVWMLPAQITANRINAVVMPGHDPNDRFSGSNVATIALGGLLLALAIFGFFLKPHRA